MIFKQHNRTRLWNNSYDRTSFVLGLGLLTVTVASFYFFVGWRHDLMVGRCMSLYGMDFRPGACSYATGLNSWVAASVEGLPFVGAVVLVLQGLGYAFLREQLELGSYQERGDAFFCLLWWALGATFVPLVLMGIVELIFLSHT